jgi:L-ascorbate metabolism protein UlaG (beta-lactamase superfamily)
VQVLPALHSCLFAASDRDSAAGCFGDLGISAQERRRKIEGGRAVTPSAAGADAGPAAAALARMREHSSGHDGGQLAYLLRTGEGSALFSGSSGYWPGIYHGLQPDVAFLALAGRPNVAGEPYQGSSARFMLEQAEVLRPGKVCFCHHDQLLPGRPGTDVTEASALLEARNRGSYLTLDYATARPLFA